MDVVSLCPLQVAVLPWQPRHGAFALTVICKGTFELQPGESPLAAIQEPAWDTPLVTDLVPFKRKADVFVVGRAYPTEKNVGLVNARLAVGKLDKTAVVHADIGWSVVDVFGPLPPTSAVRTALLGEYAGAWNHRAWNVAPVPQNIDAAYFNAAPADQQVPTLAGEEDIVLEWLHPVFPRLKTKVARIVPQAKMEGENGQTQDVRLRCDTLCIDTVRRRAMLVWRGVAMLGSASERGCIVVTSGPQTECTAARLAMTSLVEKTHVFEPVLPFSQESSTAKDVDWAATRLLTHPVGAKPVVPFARGLVGSGAAPSDVSTTRMLQRRAEEEFEGTRQLLGVGVATMVKPDMPFEKAEKRSQEVALQSPVEDSGRLPTQSLSDTAPLPENVEPAPTVVEKPAMIGPIPVDMEPIEVVQPIAGLASEEITPPSDIIAAQEMPCVEISLESYATIKAELGQTGMTRSKVIESHGLRHEDWTHAEQRWTVAIEEESPTGKQVLRERYDVAYVACIERFRGRITADDYARVLVALERGKPKLVLDALRIHHGGLMPLLRLWTKRVAADGKVWAEATEALRCARSR